MNNTSETIHLDIDLVRELVCTSVGDSLEGWTVVHREDIDQLRWSQVSRVVIRDDDGQHYDATYETGLTEYQDHTSFDDCATYPFAPVVARTRMIEVTEYVAVEGR